MKKRVKKLVLAKETVRSLGTDQTLAEIQGGWSEFPCTGSCDVQCKLDQVTGRWCA